MNDSTLWISAVSKRRSFVLTVIEKLNKKIESMEGIPGRMHDRVVALEGKLERFVGYRDECDADLEALGA